MSQKQAEATEETGFRELSHERSEAGPTQDLDFLLDIPLQITVELGRTRMLIKDLLQLSQGSVVELEKLAGEPMDILISNKLVARGEVVHMGSSSAIESARLTQGDRLVAIAQAVHFIKSPAT